MRLLRLLLLCTLAGVSASAVAQYANQPYFDSSDRLRYAFAMNLMEVRLDAIETVVEQQGVLPDDLVEQAERLLTDDLPRIAGSLEAAARQQFDDLRETLEAVEDAASSGGKVALPEAIEQARYQIERARETLLGGAMAQPPVAAAAMSRLLLGEPGVGEGYEEAVAGERWEYTLGWAALQRVREIWSDLSPTVAGRSDEVDEALAELDQLLPGPVPPENLSGDPEAGEEPAHRITSLLEGITDANLYPERELGRVAALGADQAGAACTAFQEGDENLGLELSLAVQDTYESISGTVGMLASEAHERVEGALAAITGGSGEDEEEESAGEAEEEEAAELSPAADSLLACTDLRRGLEQIAGLFGG